jgi:hypothetical protein
MSRTIRTIPVFIALAFFSLPSTLRAAGAETGTMVIPVDLSGSVSFRTIEDGGDWQTIAQEGSGTFKIPGKPMLPARTLRIALPPGARVTSVDIERIDPSPIPGSYRIHPAPKMMPLIDADRPSKRMEALAAEWRENFDECYGSDRPWPEVAGRLVGSGTLRKYAYAAVSLYPFRYHPASGRLVRYASARVTIHYDIPSPGSLEAERLNKQLIDTVVDKRAEGLFVNYDDVKALYSLGGIDLEGSREAYDYVIVTTPALRGAVEASEFIAWKEWLGYRLRTVLTTDPEIAGQPGRDLAEQIRTFLRNTWASWGIEYLLLVGDYAAIPMRYCYPDSTNHWNNAGVPNAESGEVPTDAYYADLSAEDDLSWDLDGDGFYGEFGQDAPDLLAEVYVGRIPTNDLSRITYTLDKLAAYEQDTGSWKRSALHAGAIWYFTNEDRLGYELYDGATCMDMIETNLMDGWTITHYSERAGLEKSTFVWDPLTEHDFIGSWRNGEYGVVNWGAHGWSNSAARKIWYWDDGDGVPETGNPNEMMWLDFINTSSNLDDDHPSVFFAISCVIGYPEPNAWGNIGIDLLTKPGNGASIGSLGATRITWGASGWPDNPGGAESMCFEFNRHLIGGPAGPEPVGDALYDSKWYCTQNYGFYHYAEYWNQFNYNLYGDPALVREGIAVQIFDDTGAEFTVINGTWPTRDHPDAVNGSTRYTAPDPGARAGWRIDGAVEPGEYDVYVWKFEHALSHLMAEEAPYRVVHRDGSSDWIPVDQSAPGNEWICLGRFAFDDSRPQGVMVAGSPGGHVLADAVKLVRR